MRNVKIVADSSADVLERQGVPFAVAPLKIITNEKEFVDDAALDVHGMVSWFDSYKGKSKTSCPNSGEWLEAFGDADEIFCVTITSGLSGSYNSACVAKQMYEEQHPGKRVYVVDSLSAGPELVLILEQLEA
jgi:fatty acid-binding protein DegV